jgi:hypothetical protein
MQMEVGTEDLILDVKTHLDKDDTLIVEQFMINKSDRLADFRCYLIPRTDPDAKATHRRQRMQVYRLGSKMDRKVYRIPDGRSLVGSEMFLEIEEVNGPRWLKYRFVATEEAPVEKRPEDSADQLPADEKQDDTTESSHVANRR